MGKCVGELIVNIGGLRRHLLPTATLEYYLLVENENIFYIRRNMHGKEKRKRTEEIFVLLPTTVRFRGGFMAYFFYYRCTIIVCAL